MIAQPVFFLIVMAILVILITFFFNVLLLSVNWENYRTFAPHVKSIWHLSTHTHNVIWVVIIFILNTGLLIWLWSLVDLYVCVCARANTCVMDSVHIYLYNLFCNCPDVWFLIRISLIFFKKSAIWYKYLDIK